MNDIDFETLMRQDNLAQNTIVAYRHSCKYPWLIFVV